jgi:hypothetical protein
MIVPTGTEIKPIMGGWCQPYVFRCLVPINGASGTKVSRMPGKRDSEAAMTAHEIATLCLSEASGLAGPTNH